MMDKKIPKAVLMRLPIYLHYLKTLPRSEKKTISSSAIAGALKLGEVQVRKDLALVSGAGKPKIGYFVDELIGHLEHVLGSRNITKAVIVGAGKLGKALMFFDGFPEYGIMIDTAFDCDGSKCGPLERGKQILPMEKLKDYCRSENIKIGIITVPEKEAQKVCDSLVDAGVSAIWNFASASLETPDGVKVKNENIASSLAVLSCNC